MIVLHSIIHTIQCLWNGNHGKLTRSGISGKFGFVVLKMVEGLTYRFSLISDEAGVEAEEVQPGY